ncbi:Uncharacterised protein [uncultured archaeon]|nr:Uncharacterised protein [uncultured archaeon]
MVVYVFDFDKAVTYPALIVIVIILFISIFFITWALDSRIKKLENKIQELNKNK